MTMQAEAFRKNVVTIQDGNLAIPEDIREELDLHDGRRVMLITDGEEVRIVNPLMHAIRKLQEGMKGAADEAGWTSDDEVAEYIMEMRRSHYEDTY